MVSGEVVDYEKCHSCEKSDGKIVVIEIDMVGNTYCGYCHEKVNYKIFKNGN